MKALLRVTVPGVHTEHLGARKQSWDARVRACVRQAFVGRALAESGRDHDPAMALLWLGVLARIVVSVVLPPANNDGPHHIEYVEYVAQHHAIPLASYGLQTYQPPLYYVLAALVWSVRASEKFVQLLSLMLSLATLWGYHRLLVRTEIIPDRTGRLYAFAVASLLPQFVLFGLYVSNDTLAIGLGVLAMHRVWRFVWAPTQPNAIILALAVGAGLLTKGVFLPFVPILTVVIAVLVRPRHGAGWAAGAALSFVALTVAVGGYKYAESAIHFGNPWVSNLDFDHRWVQQHKGTVRGPDFIANVNVLDLVRWPTVGPAEAPRSFPLLLYGTFWYQHIPESGFVGNRCAPTKYLGSLIYLAAVVPTLTVCAGALALVRALVGPRTREGRPRLLMTVVSVALFLSNILLLLLVVLRHDVWSVLQARLFFPALFGGLVLFGYGVGFVRRQRRARRVLDGSMAVLGGLCGLYFASEVGLQVASALDASAAEWLAACAR